MPPNILKMFWGFLRGFSSPRESTRDLLEFLKVFEDVSRKRSSSDISEFCKGPCGCSRSHGSVLEDCQMSLRLFLESLRTSQVSLKKVLEFLNWFQWVLFGYLESLGGYKALRRHQSSLRRNPRVLEEGPWLLKGFKEMLHRVYYASC